MISPIEADWPVPGAPDALSAFPGDNETIPVFARWFGSWRISVQRRALNTPQLSRSYDLAAPRWGRKLDRLGFPQAYEAMLRGLLREEAPAASGGQVRALDCGVGTGALSLALARVLPGLFRLDAIDISPRMLEQADCGFRDMGLEVALRHGDVRALPYDNDVFDLVMSAHLLEHLADPVRALAEMVRVLKPGGLLIICLTRRSYLGTFVQLKWRTHRVTPVQAESWLRQSGLDQARCLPFDQRTICRRLSVACAGKKPS